MQKWLMVLTVNYFTERSILDVSRDFEYVSVLQYLRIITSIWIMAKYVVTKRF